MDINIDIYIYILKIRFCAPIGGRKSYLLRKPKLSPEASFELQPTKRQNLSFRLRRPSNYSRQNFKTSAFTSGFLRITAGLNFKNSAFTWGFLRNTAPNFKKPKIWQTSKTQLSHKASFELQLRPPSNYRRPKRQKHSFHLRLPSNYSSKLPSNYSRQNTKTQLSPEASWDLQYEAST